jgi:hypothetical protein
MRIRIQEAKPMQIQADPDPDLSHKKLNVHMKNIFEVGKRSKTYGTYEGTKTFLKGRKSGLFSNLGQFPCSRIRIQDS